jgi:Leucine-rich repeat (LRR) protein
MHGNSLTGAIPESFSNWSSLTYFDLSGNQLNGAIPDAFSS